MTRPVDSDDVFPGILGETAALLRDHDWSRSPLGHPASWPAALKTATGLMLTSRFPMFLAWGPDLVFLYNDAYAEILGGKHPAAMGARFADIWAEIWDDVGPLAEAAVAGRSVYRRDLPLVMNRHGHEERTWFTFSYSPLADEAGDTRGMFCAVTETTEQVLARARQEFRLGLDDRLRHMADPEEIKAAAAAHLGVHLGAGRVGYAEVEETGTHLVVEADWTDGSMASVAGRHHLDAFGPPIIGELRAGRTMSVDDVDADPRLSPAAAAAFAAIGTRSVLAVPLIKEGRFLALLYIHHHAPRRWSAEDRLLTEDIAERTWSAVERARAAQALKESEAHLRNTVELNPQAPWTCDTSGRITSYTARWLEMTGQAPGEPLGDGWRNAVWPDDLPGTLERFGRSLASGEPVDVEYRIRRKGAADPRWVRARAYPLRDETGAITRWYGLVEDVHDRKVAELRLRQSEEQLRLATEAAEVGFWDVDEVNDVLFWPPRVKAMFGISPDVPVTMADFYAGLHADDREAVAAAYASATDPARRAAYDVEYRTVGKEDGIVRWVAAKGRGLFDDEGRCLRVLGTAIDITRRKAIEEELRRLNEDLESQVAERTAERDQIWRLSRDLMCVARTDGTLLSVNPAWERVLGWPADWLEGRNAAEIKHPDDAERTAAELSRLASGEPTSVFEDRYRHKDGTWRWISWAIQPYGGLIYCIGRDVTEDKAVSQALQAAETARKEADALYRAYFENTPEALFVVQIDESDDFRVEQMNPAHQATMGMRLADVVGRRIVDILPAEAARKAIAGYREAIRTRAAHHYRENFELPGGVEYWDSVLMPVASETGRITRVIGSGRNVTAQVRAEEALRQAQKMEAVGQLTGGIAHDFNNVLGAVVGALDLIRRKPGDEDRVRRFAEAALETAERGAKLTAQLLAFSRAQRLELKPVAVADLLAGISDLLARTLGPLVRVQLRLDGDGAVLSDPTQLEMAVLNLAINARDAMPSGGELVIGTRAVAVTADAEMTAGEYVEIYVSDTGTGMPPEILSRAFDPFFSTKGVGKGTGLGLSQVYGIARQAGGTVRIESEVGKGTTVRVYLPRTGEAVGRAEPAEDPVAPSRRTARILVVDDDRDVRRILAASLEALGHAVEAAEDGPAGLRRIEDRRPDLLILDFAMPGMNGAEVARAARQRHPDLPIIFASGYADTAAIDALATGIPMLRKPFRIADLQALVDDALASARTADPA
ncbi:PAS domain S-box protein [Chthonobacter rhizosphaerae]|uniref:PAS domain S-box protein n=1 Tax=Chthonobacter rhizosphaerae TaxID=2735553 RepID=UPI0015EE8A7E|nr:PAS domain S-box protein [Chthonobacter rhizosphaerae]